MISDIQLNFLVLFEQRDREEDMFDFLNMFMERTASIFIVSAQISLCNKTHDLTGRIHLLMFEMCLSPQSSGCMMQRNSSFSEVGFSFSF